MAGVLIYKSASKYHYSFVVADDKIYAGMRSDILERNMHNRILWEKQNVSLEQIENSRKTKDDLVAKLNGGEKVDLKKELDGFFE